MGESCIDSNEKFFSRSFLLLTSEANSYLFGEVPLFQSQTVNDILGQDRRSTDRKNHCPLTTNNRVFQESDNNMPKGYRGANPH